MEKIAEVARKEFNINPFLPALKSELEKLNSFYKSHRLRYGNIGDLFLNPQTIEYQLTFRKIAAVVRLANRQISNQSKAT